MQKLSLVAMAVLCLGAFGVAACSDESKTHRLCAQMSEAALDYSTRCGGAPARQISEDDITECTESLDETLALDGARLNFTASQACAGMLPSTTCDQWLDRVRGCLVFEGALPDAAPCLQHAQCFSGRCDMNGGSNTCLHVAERGEACNWNCRSGLYCIAGVCADLPDEGESCDPDLWQGCKPWLTCGGDGVCHPLPRVGEECAYEWISCAWPGVCMSNTDGAHVCVKRGALGEPCMSSGYLSAIPIDDCMDSLTCSEDQRCVFAPSVASSD